MQADLVSAVIPTFNYGHFVCAAVDSVLAQTYRPVEVIVVDDGSTDDTSERLRPYGDRIRYVYQRNQGLSAARNTGIAHARGAYVAFLDSDDIWHPQKLAVQMRYAAAHPEVGVIGTDRVAGTDPILPVVDLGAPAPTRPVSLDALVVKVDFCPSSVVVRRDCLDAVGPFDTELRSAEDRDMWIRIASRFPVARIGLPLCWYRLHANSMSRAAARMEEFQLRVLEKTFAGVGGLGRRRWLRRRAFGYAWYTHALMYRNAGCLGAACHRLLRSFAAWPLPFTAADSSVRCVRVRTLVSLGRLLARRFLGPRAVAG